MPVERVRELEDGLPTYLIVGSNASV